MLLHSCNPLNHAGRNRGWDSTNRKSGFGTCAVAFRDRPFESGKQRLESSPALKRDRLKRVAEGDGVI